MADLEIGDLTAAGGLDGTELVHVVKNGNSRKTTLAAVAGLATTGAFRGAMVKRSTNLVALVSGVYVPWEAEDYDTDAFWEIANPTRLTIPAGVSFARFTAGLSLTAAGSSGTVLALLHKNGALAPCAAPVVRQGTSGVTTNLTCFVSPPLAVVAGDYFECHFTRSSLTSAADLLAEARTFFAVEALA